MAPRSFAASHAAQPHFAAPHHAIPQVARGHAAPAPRFAAGRAERANIARTSRTSHEIEHTSRASHELARHAAAPPSSPEIGKTAGRNATANLKPGPTGNRAERQPSSRPGETVGLSRSNQGTSEAGRGRLSESQKTPILRNQVFASQSPRSIAASPSQGTFRGHFAQSAFWHERHHHHHLGVVLGFVGPVFWPYAYDDFVDYTFSPYAYDTFWPYAFDDVYAGIYGGYAPEYYAPEDAYAYAGSAASEHAYARSERVTTTGNAAAPSASERICSGQAQGLTDFSIQKIADQVQPTADQQRLLDALKAATVKAVGVLQAACPSELPSTPTGRLAAMHTRVDAMLQAVQIVRPALDTFYKSLSDEQRERFNALDQGEQSQAQAGNLDRLCKTQNTAQNRLPIDRIERTLHLKPDQEDGLKALDDATAKSAEILKDQCQSTTTLTPTGRLAAMEDRLTAMSKALETTQAALTKFYGSLSDEQKARFDRINARVG
jgi:ABC-type transporter MlaC component